MDSSYTRDLTTSILNFVFRGSRGSHLLGFRFHVGGKTQPCRVDERFVDGDVRGVNVVLLAVAADPGEGGLLFGVPGDGDAALDVSPGFPPG